MKNHQYKITSKDNFLKLCFSLQSLSVLHNLDLNSFPHLGVTGDSSGISEFSCKFLGCIKNQGEGVFGVKIPGFGINGSPRIIIQ